jgi:hypothetical protein
MKTFKQFLDLFSLSKNENKNIKTEIIHDIKVIGDDKFIAKTKQALSSLNNSETFNQIKQFIGIIEQSERSGMVYWNKPPKYEVGKATYEANSLWYASTIAHDTYHSALFIQGDNPQGKDAEIKCLKIQRKVLQEINAPKYMIKHIDEHMINPTYQDVNYEDRNW